MKRFLKHTFLRKNKEKQLKHNDKTMPHNIYGTKTYSEYYKKFNTVHFIFKYKFVVPLLIIGKKLLGKYLVKEAPPGHHNRNLKLFDEAFDEAMKKWIELSIRNSGPREKRMTKKQCEARIKNDHHLHIIKELVNTIYVYDRAYRDFINVLMHEITSSMMTFYSEIPGKKTGHLFHTVDLYETQYFVMEKTLTYNTTVTIERAEDLLEENEK